MKTYLVKYLKPNTHTFYDIIKSKEEIEIESVIAKEVDAEKKKKLKAEQDWKRLTLLRSDIVFVPGINELPENHYELLMEHPSFEQHFDTRPPSMQWVPGFGPDDKELKVFSNLKDRDALDVVESMWAKPLIEKYLATEKRETIKKALETQLDKLIIKPKKAA